MADIAEIGFRADTSGLMKAEKGLDNLSKQGAKTDKAMSGAGASIGKSFAGIAAAVGGLVSATSAMQKLIATSREFDVLNAGLITATGSAENATAAFKAIEDFATTTPYSLGQATKAFTQLVNLGLTPSERALTSYGNTAAAMGKDLSQMVEAVADATVGEFERLKEFGIKARSEGDNVSFTFRGMTATVKKSAAEIEGYLIGLGQNEFASAMANRMNTLDGAISNLSDSWDGLFRTISSQGAGDLITSGVRMATDAISELTDMISSGQLGAYLDAIGFKFKAWGADIAVVLDAIGQLFAQAGEYWYLDMSESSRLMVDAFKNMPENIRALIQIATVELSAFVDGVAVYAKAIASYLDFTEESVNIAAEFERISAARDASLASIMGERDAALQSFNSQITAADGLRIKYDQLNSSVGVGVDRLAAYKVQATESAAATAGLATAMVALDDAMSDHMSALEELDEIEKDRIARKEEEIAAMVEPFEAGESAIDSLIDKIGVLGGAWSSSGSAMIDAFGSAGDVIDDYMKRVGEISSLEMKLKEVRDDSASSAQDKAKAEIGLLELQYQGQRANLSMLSKTAGAAASMFKEQSKERKALHSLEKAFAAVEIALAIQKAGANAVAAITNQGGGDPYSAFGRIAAMMAIMAGLGVFSGGSSGGYAAPTQGGTGTVTGDSSAQSSSITKIQDEYKDIALDQLAELRSISESMTALSSGIAGLAVSLVRSSSFGGANVQGLGTTQSGSGIINIADKLGLSGILGSLGDNIIGKVLGGIFGSTKKSLLDTGFKFDAQSIADILSGGFEGYYFNVIETTKKKLFGISKKTTIGTELSDVEDSILSEIGGIFKHLAGTVTAAVDSLGIDTTNAIESFVVNLGSISFKGMKGEDIQKELEAMFSQQGDLMALYVLPQIAKYQQMGEGALETLLRVAKEQAVFDDGLEKIGQSLGDLSNILRVDVAQSIITMMGGLDKFNSAVNTYFEEFFTETEQFDYLTKQLTEAFASLGLPMADTKEEFRALVDGLDLTTEAGQAMFAALMELVPGLAEWIKLSEQQAEQQEKTNDFTKQREQLEIRLQEALGNSAAALEMRRQIELASVDESLRALLEQIYAAEDAATAQRELAAAQAEAAATARSAAQSAFGRLQEAADAEKQKLQTELDLKLETIDKEREALLAQRDTVIAGYQAQGQAVEQYISKLEGISDVINGFIGGTGSSENPFRRLAQMLSEARGGLLPEQGELSSVLGAIQSSGSAGFGSALEQQRAMAIARSQAAGIGDIVGGRLSGARSQSAMIAQQIEDANAFYEAELLKLDQAAELAQQLHDEQVALIDKQLSDAEKQLNALLGVDDRILSMTDALAEFYASLESATAIQISKQDEQIAATYAVAAAVADAAGYWAGPEQMAKPDAPMNTDNVGAPVTEDMITLLKEIVATSKANADHASKSASMLQEMTVGGLDVRVEA